MADDSAVQPIGPHLDFNIGPDTVLSFVFLPSLQKWRNKLKIGVKALAIIPFSGRFFLPIPFKTISKFLIGEFIKDQPRREDVKICADLYPSSLIKNYNKHKSEGSRPLKVL